MAVPKYDDLMSPTIEALKQLGGSGTNREIEQKVGELLHLSNDELNTVHRGATTQFMYRMAWSRNYLKRFGLIDKIDRGKWKLTAKGKEIDYVDKDEVKRVVKKIDLKEAGKYDLEGTLFDVIEDDNPKEERTNSDDIVSPFDPKDIKIIVEPKTIDHLVARLREDEIDLNTEFQRKGNLWKADAQSRLIESILLRLPLPAFYFDATNDDKWLVVDGLQRLWSIKNFIVNAGMKDEANPPMSLTGLEILLDYSDKGITYDKLNRTMQRRILETPITTYLIQPGTPKNVKYNVFKRINTGGLGLNAMEIRNALNQGNPSNFLRELSEDADLKAILNLQDKRMEDRELLLRAYAFIDKDYNEYQKPLSTFLDKAMESLETKNVHELDKLSNGIIEAIFFQEELFGKHIFSRSLANDRIKVRLNSALFEVWVSEVYRLDKKKQDILLGHKEALIAQYKILLDDQDFINAVATSTSGKKSVITRFEQIRGLIQQFVS